MGTELESCCGDGCCTGVGLATASLLARLGFRVLLTDIQALDAPLERLRADHLPVTGLRGDITSEEFVRELSAAIARDHGAADVLVNNAGISCIAPAEDTTAEQWQRVLSVNLFAPFLLCKHLGAQMLRRKSGSIVNVASVAGLAGVSHRSAYNASKHGLVGLTRTLAAEWGGRGVRVNAVCPGWIKTEMDAADQGRGAYSDQDITARVPQASRGRKTSPRRSRTRPMTARRLRQWRDADRRRRLARGCELGKPAAAHAPLKRSSRPCASGPAATAAARGARP
jgi:NAD(P)-dependent dehydrogenase (short-subunit alcohol dehydrogenase family)